MKRIKLAVAALVIAAGAFGTYAFTNANADTEKAAQTLWVIGKSGDNYIVSDNPDDAGPCNGTLDPCEIFTNETPDANHELTPEQMENSRIDGYQNL